MRTELRFWNALVIIVLLTGAVFGPVSRTVQAALPASIDLSEASPTYTQNFDTLSNTGTTNVWTNTTTLPAWYSNRIVYIADNGSSTSGGLHSHGATASTERALGSLGSGPAATVLYGALFTNTASHAITSLTVSYTGEQWRVGSLTPNTLTFEYQVGVADIAAVTPWTGVSALNFVNPILSAAAAALDGNAAANRTVLTATFPVSVPAGGTILLRWRDIDDASADSGLAVDDLTVTAAAFDLPAITGLTLSQSEDGGGTWTPLAGTIGGGYRLTLSGLTDVLLDAPSVTSSYPLADGLHPFLLDTTSVPASYYTYWAAKNVTAEFAAANPTSWQAAMWPIVNGTQPMFYLSMTAGASTLVDGLRHVVDPANDRYVTLSKDYPFGNYRFDGTLTDSSGASNTQTFSLAVGAPLFITGLDLTKSIDQAAWKPVAGSLAGGYSLKLDPAQPFYYLNVANVVASSPLDEGSHPFTLDQADLPAAFFPYWSAKDVNATYAAANPDSWQAVMWEIINGRQPIFYLVVTEQADSQSFMLADGLSRLASPPGTPDAFLRLSGDYPAGTYNFSGTITDASANSNTQPVKITFAIDQPVVVTAPAEVHLLPGGSTSFTFSATDPDGIITGVVFDQGAGDYTLAAGTPAGTPALGWTWTATVTLTNPTAVATVPLTITASSDSSSDFVQTGSTTLNVVVYPTTCSDPAPAYPLVTIAQIQGSGPTSPLLVPPASPNVSVRGQVVGSFLGSARLNGFFVQDAGDADPATSDGVFVYASAYATMNLQVGEFVQVSGVVSEFSGLTELTPPAGGNIILCGSSPVITPTDVNLPFASAAQIESFEGMLLRFPQTLTITDNYNLTPYGELALSNDGRLFNITNGQPLRTGTTNALSQVTIDDGVGGSYPNPIPYLQGSGSDITLRVGNTLNGALVGTMTTISNLYMVEPTQALTFDTTVNPRSDTPPAVGGSLKIAGFNLLNYFVTLNNGTLTPPYNSSNTPRGATTAQEFQRQQEKLVAAIIGLNADILGMTELESYAGANAVQSLVDAVNAGYPAGSPLRYQAIPVPAGGYGGDYIKVDLIYRPAVVTAVLGGTLSDNDTLFERFPVAQEFESGDKGERFFVVVNHFKSKSSCPTDPADVNAEHGQGCWNAKRTDQANALVAWINTTLKPIDPDVAVIGDLNAYGREDPILALEAGGLVNEITKHVPFPEQYSYNYSAESGNIDHTFATPSLDLQLTGTGIWHINSDEPKVLDYSDKYTSSRAKTAFPYFPTLYRSSDHDPVISGLSLFANAAPQVAAPISNQDVYWGRVWDFTVPAGTFSDANAAAGDTLSYSASLESGPLPAWLSLNPATRTFSGTPPVAAVGPLNLKVTAMDLSGASASNGFTLQILNHNPVVDNLVGPWSATVNAAFSNQVPLNTFSDLDIAFGDSLTYTATLADGSPLPAWLTFTAATRTFSGTPGFFNGGHLQIKVTATDLGGLSVSTTFELVVEGLTYMPIMGK